jgi:hypothetical protein
MERMRVWRAISVAALFVASGLLTFKLYSWGERSSHPHDFFTDAWFELRTGLPFATASTTLWARPLGWIPLIAFLDCLAWLAAYWVAIFLWSRTGTYVSMATAGLVGALGVTLFTGLGCRRLWSSKWLIRAAITGAVAGIPFGMFSNTQSTPNENVLVWSFPLWQTVLGVGFYLKNKTAVSDQ